MYAVQNWPIPTNITEVPSFFIYRSFLKNIYLKFLNHCTLSQLTRKSKRFKSDEHCQKAFHGNLTLTVTYDE